MSKYFGEYFGPSTRRPYFSTQMPQLFVIKICFTFKINTIYGTGQDTRNLCNKFNYQGSAIRILYLTVASPKSKDASSRVLSVTAPCPRIKILGSLVLGSRVPGLRVPGSPFSGPDLRISHFDTMSVLQDFCQKYMILVFTSQRSSSYAKYQAQLYTKPQAHVVHSFHISAIFVKTKLTVSVWLKEKTHKNRKNIQPILSKQ